MSAHDAARMRSQLASVGIFLPEPATKPTAKAHAATTTNSAAVDRELVRRILVSAGAPRRALEWLTASCPSVDDALTFQPLEEL
jgi:hypothetical protein